MFHIKIEKNVTHNDRDIEIIEFKHNIKSKKDDWKVYVSIIKLYMRQY